MASGLRRDVPAVLGNRALSPIALSLFAHGLSQGMTVPLFALWLVRAYHGGPGLIAAYFTATAVFGLAVNPLLGRLSDAWGHRRYTAATAALCQSVGLALLACHPPLAVVLAVATLPLATQVQPHLFALVDDHIGAGSPGLPRGVTVATLRAMISAAWVFGAPLGGLLAGAGFSLVLALAAVVNAGSAAITLGLCRDGTPARPQGGHAARRAAVPPPGRAGQLGLFSLATALAVAGNAAKMQAVPLYLARLGLPVAAVGITYGWMALGELVLMPPVGRLADRVSRRHVIALGAVGGVIFFGAIALVPGPLVVLAAFPAISLLIAALYGVGIGYAQDLDPQRVGLAGGLFFAAQGVGTAGGGPLLAAAEGAFGLPGAFLLPAALIGLSCVGVLLTRPVRGIPPLAVTGPVAVPAGD